MEIPAWLLTYCGDWINLLLRWLHVITGIAWIGASFYFVWLDLHIRPPAPGSRLAEQGVAGELWAVHGGGFYNPQKYLVAPPELPTELHWFKWEAYSTWLSGFALLSVVYYLQPQAMLMQAGPNPLSPAMAVGLGLASLAGAWLIYDGLCRTRLVQTPLLLGLVLYGLLVAAAFGLSHYFSGRATYIHIGAMIGTIMVGNVFFVIIPGQRKLVAALSARQSPDPQYGIKAKQRSLHNNYFTLPVLLIMISNHYAMTYNHPKSYLVLAALMASGVLIRHFFNLRHQGRTVWGYPLAGCAILLVLAILLAPAPATTNKIASSAKAQADTSAQAHAIIVQRCVGCHAEHPTFAGFVSAPAGIVLASPAQIEQHAAKIYQQVVQNRAMPLGNLTQMSESERQLIASWYQTRAAK
ncbi:MAG: hypothetical protein RL748_1296 [Pseudomonadota bacterium]|jgi:uncharacterized membrane protein